MLVLFLCLRLNIWQTTHVSSDKQPGFIVQSFLLQPAQNSQAKTAHCSICMLPDSEPIKCLHPRELPFVCELLSVSFCQASSWSWAGLLISNWINANYRSACNATPPDKGYFSSESWNRFANEGWGAEVWGWSQSWNWDWARMLLWKPACLRNAFDCSQLFCTLLSHILDVLSLSFQLIQYRSWVN